MSFTSRKSPYFSKSSQGTFHAQEIQSQLEAKGNFPPLPLMAQPAAPKNGRTSVTLEYNGHTIEALASSSTNRYWGVEVTLTWTDGMIENKMKFGPYEISCSQNDAESWGVLAALRWIDAGKPNTEALITLH